MIFKFTTILLLLIVITTIEAKCDKGDEEYFLTFHPHLDAFWLNTDDELKNINFRPQGFLFAMNQRNSKTIFNSMLEALRKNQMRKYFVTEVVFFKDWYEYISAADKDQVKKLLENGQLQITNGGWVQNDEAVCYYDDIIDQYTVGINFLYSQFGIVPKIAWATDSFGHSHSQVAVQHLLGFQSQAIERIDDRYIYRRKGGSLLQFYWSAVSDSNNKKYGGVFTYIRHFLHEVNDLRFTNTNMIKDDNKNVKQIMDKLYRRNKKFRFLGNDFEEFITSEFQVLEKSIKQLNDENKTECPSFKYGNPTNYFQAVKSQKGDGISVRQNDFMPNFDQDHYWSGYYTTDPDLKKICKDYSRLVNIFRKIYVKSLINGGNENPNIRKLLIDSDELLAIMQHHDGITATSKTHIQNLFKDRMRQKTNAIINSISQIKNLPKQSCNLYQNNNKCELKSNTEQIFLSVLHEGLQKTQRIQLSLSSSVYYDVQGNDHDNTFCSSSGKCTLIFDTLLLPGQNVIKLKKVSEESIKSSIFRESTFSGQTSQGNLRIQVSESQIKYTSENGDYIHLDLVMAANTNSQTNTETWNKYGHSIKKLQNREAGIYIMSNSGKIIPINQAKIKTSSIIRGTKYFRLNFESDLGRITITVNKEQPSFIQVESTFKPPTREAFDYFLKIDSPVKSKGQFYQDMNGYLVSKRKVGYRPDYEWNYKPQDKINANTYPICSFAYGIDGDKKIVIFSDRAQGFAQYDDSYLINIDRLARDDFKGVGQGYYNQVENTFKHIIGLVKKNNFIQRELQRQFDQPLIAYYSEGYRQSATFALIENLDPKLNTLKYTIFSLNAEQFVLRLHNLGQNYPVSLSIFGKRQWLIKELGLHLKYSDIKQSFASGIPLSERFSWAKIPQEISIFTAGSKDSHQQIIIDPLQIRSFRINLKNTISFKEKAIGKIQSDIVEASKLKKNFANRCF